MKLSGPVWEGQTRTD